MTVMINVLQDYTPVVVHLFQDTPDGLLCSELVPPDPPDQALQALWRRQETIVLHNAPQKPADAVLCVRSRHEGPEWRCIEVNHTPVIATGNMNQHPSTKLPTLRLETVITAV